MKRTYSYRNFEVVIELEAEWDAFRGAAAAPPCGYVAVVHIRKTGDNRPFVAPMRLTSENNRPFGIEADALMAGYSAAQRLIDDILSV